MEVILLPAAEAEVYSYVNKEYCDDKVTYQLGDPEQDPTVRAAEEVALRAWRTLNCRDGGRIDIRCDASGVPCFLEVNPLAGIHPEHSDLPILAGKRGISYVDLIGRMDKGTVDALVFTSSPQVDRLFEVAEMHGLQDELRRGFGRTKVAAVGPVLAESLRGRGVRVDVCPEQGFVMKNLVQQVKRAFEG